MGDYHELYVQTDTLLLADIFEKFREKCVKIYGLDPSYFYSAPGLAWRACLEKTRAKLELLADIDMLLMIEKVLEEECANQHIDMLKMQTIYMDGKYLKNYL